MRDAPTRSIPSGVYDIPHIHDVLSRTPEPGRGELPVQDASRALRILFLVSAHNSLSQRAHIALTELGHDVEVAVVDSGEAMEAAVARHRPELIVCPMLKKLIPASIYDHHRCLVVHPGPVGDRGPSSLDWAIELGMREWGVTVLEATGEVDGGDVWGTATFRTRETGKSSLYRHEVRRAAVERAAGRHGGPGRPGLRAAPARPRRPGRVTAARGRSSRQAARAIDWSSDSTETVVRRIRAAEGHPGVLDTVEGAEFHLFGVHRERGLRGRPGEIIATRHGAICRATVDGAVWITHLKRSDASGAKLPATHALELAGRAPDAPEVRVDVHAPIPEGHTWREISYTEEARRRLPALRLLQRRDEHRAVPAPARGLPLRARPAHDAGSSCSRAAATSSPTGSTSTSSRRRPTPARSPGGTCTRSTTSCAR